MTEISRAALFGKLNPLAYKAIDSAFTFCKLRGNPYVELVHWFNQIIQVQDSDLHRISGRFQLDPAGLARDLTEALDRLPRGARSSSDLSSDVEEAVKEAWSYATLMFGASQVRTGHLLVGILKTKGLRGTLLGISRQFDKVQIDALIDTFAAIVAGSPEERMAATAGSPLDGGAAPGEASEAMAPAQMGKQQALKQFSVDLTERARKGELDPIVGRDEEIRQLIDILMRRRQNNPILTGEAGVGKTAVVEGFALRIAAGDVPPPLKEVTLRTLDVGLLQAGASMKGEFENRLRQVIEEVQASPKPIILFIDEAHTLIGAGGSAGTGDAANLLKPALARGTLRTVAATTWAEYKKYIEKDPALTRRFQVVQVDEPSEEKAILMLRGLASTLENHHQVQLLDEGLEAAVRLSHRYIPARQLPDKAVSLLDTACARVAISQSSEPAEVEDCRRRIEALETELGIIGRESAVGVETAERERSAGGKLAAERERLVGLQARWDAEQAVVAQILDLRAQLRGTAAPVEGTGSALEQAAGAAAGSPAPVTQEAPALSATERAAALEKLRALQTELAALQGESPLILPSVDAQAIASVVADWTGIPVGRMVKDEVKAVLNLAETLNRRVVGQRHALDAIAARIQTSRARLDNPNKPIGVFMLAGPSGVGKTETGLALAEALYGGEQNIITINMSEFQEAHTVSTLKGAPPGYVGYGEGGILTEAVRRKPYSVVLLDEVEKAHPDVHEIFFQVFDKGWMEDAEGRYIDFHNTVILLTTNVGTDLVMGLCKDPELMPDMEGLAQALRAPLLKTFPPALLGRIVTIPYYPLSDDILATIIRLQLERIVQRIADNHRAELRYDEAVVDLIAKRCAEVESGARVVDAILTNTVLPAISREILNRTMAGKGIERISIGVAEAGFSYCFEG
ncbi:type VI secretion system ATPase TssH [Candidatus Thiodictyon syntrophicum]|jgi:type VI secretion system protein VasG|uniref:ClpV1 family T6SS ATPase n=1 Tax=Candidatus Thiodictyon syntrophicum TaxID=1166950 RepID=A0A2K8UJ82_9GAMM|nr:type VI secretion system ATPase TssH [Candidatus Thiodictyon syntrophicum]AUB85634.1 ClpV1 family T6SS ATPase [Candidatus Thiodictyon syntrophicum]